MKVAVYLRLSRDTAESTSIARQREACVAVAKGRWPGADVDVFEDVDISGYKDVARPEFERMMANIASYDALVVYRIDRLTRRGVRHLLEMVEDVLTPAGCALVSATEPVDTTGPFSELFLVLLAVFAKMESQRLGERQVATKAFRRSQHKWTGGRMLYGYRRVPADGGGWTLEPDPDAAPLVQQVALQVLSGVPLDRARPKDSPVSSYTGWRRLLRNPAIAGYLTHRGEIVFDDEGEPIQAWPAIVEPALFRQLQPLITADGTRKAARKSLLGGLAVCGVCGRRMKGAYRPRWPSYQCVSHNGVSMPAVDGLVLGEVNAHLPALRAEAAREAQRRRQGDGNAELEKQRAAVAAFREKIDEYDAEGLSPNDPAVRLTEARLIAAMRRVDEIQKEAEDSTLGVVLSLVPDGVGIDKMPLDVQRRLVESATKQVTIRPPSRRGNTFDPDRVEVDFIDFSQEGVEG